MFEDSLFETGGRLNLRRGWTTLLSFALQACAVGLLILVPLLYTNALPALRRVDILPPPPRGAARPPEPQRPRSARQQSEIIGHTLLQPRSIPLVVAELHEDVPPPPNPGPAGPLVTGATGDPNGVANSILTPQTPVHPTLNPPERKTPLPVSSGVVQGNLMSQVKPQYPHTAIAARVQGQVVLVAIISKQGTIENLQTVSGHPLLVPAAIEAVRLWRYRPYLLNGVPVEVETQITVNFSLGAP